MSVSERQRLYSETRTDLLNRQRSNSQIFDRSILSLSTAFLEFSLAFIRDVTSPGESNYLWLLFLSWILFGLAIVSTVLSIISSQSGIEKQLIYAQKYYLDREDEYLDQRNWQAGLTNWLFHFSGIIFIIAILSTIVFVITNSTGGRL